MLNWTAGRRSLDHAIAATQIQAILSARSFFDQIEGASLALPQEALYFLDDLKQKRRLGDLLLLGGLALLRFAPLFRGIAPSETAVLLFTSGTESLPKGVPLSHDNLLSNQRATLACVKLDQSTIMYGVLPPFHSFGFSLTGLLPLLAGLKVYYGQDPTDAHGMARTIAAWKATLLCAAPSFLQGLFQAARPGQLESLRLVVAGAERTPEALFAAARLAGKELIEGYGITECSPVVALMRPGEAPSRKGVGRAIPGVELAIIDPISLEPLPVGEEGEICVAGPGVFAGYLEPPPPLFWEHAGKRWYRTRDRGHLEADGTLVVAGRFKRFVKMGGEMLSLEALETDLRRWAQCPVAIVARESDGAKPELLLFATRSLERDGVNQALKELGWGRIAKVGRVHQLEGLPLTGTGKVHYRALEEMT
jgi:long-chain-fatty-acid--[acyl-carrier-protein] ligase